MSQEAKKEIIELMLEGEDLEMFRALKEWLGIEDDEKEVRKWVAETVVEGGVMDQLRTYDVEDMVRIREKYCLKEDC
ncbi:MAG: hypothetical protein H3Z50_03915 [archaeon]|nr:hypothetical protein [archaeon]MCP8306590.1 hypothetical protein [archaeon]